MRVGVILLILTAIFYTRWQSVSIYGGDAGDLVSAAYLGGVAHPPGFPIYSFIGYLVSRIPISTPAWRISLLSSIPQALTIFFLYLICLRLTKSAFSSIIGVSTLAFIYLFWLYASVPEVFALNNLFTVLLVYILILWKDSKKPLFLYLISLTFGLSLSHHPIIVFLLPAVFYWILINRGLIPKIRASILLKLCFFFLLGLTPYLYLMLAGLKNPLLSWGDPVNLVNLFKLATRAAYGGFTSGTFYAPSPLSRFIQFGAILEFLKTDFTPVLLIIIAGGAIYQWYTKRRIFYFFALAFIFAGPLFFFYASYYIISTFNLATFERFLLPAYIFLTVWLAEGFFAVKKGLESAIMSFISSQTKRILPALTSLVFLIFPTAIFLTNYPKISILRGDQTAENLAADVLSTPDKNSILILQRDTVLFNSQYLYFTKGVRPDIMLFHFQKLIVGEHDKQIKKYYKGVKTPKKGTIGNKYLNQFAALNYDKFPVWSNEPFNINMGRDKTFWVRYGLLYKLYKAKDLPPMRNILARNKELWDKYHDPMSGSLAKYKNLMLANVLDFYREGYIYASAIFFQDGDLDSALEYLDKAQRIDPDNGDIYYLRGNVYLAKKDCERANRETKKALSIDSDEDIYLELSYSIYKNCFKDEARANEVLKILNQLKKKKETPVERL